MHQVVKDLKAKGWKVNFEDEADRKYDGGRIARVSFYGLEKDGQGLYVECGPVDYICPDREENT